jgi:endonuclease-3
MKASAMAKSSEKSKARPDGRTDGSAVSAALIRSEPTRNAPARPPSETGTANGKGKPASAAKAKATAKTKAKPKAKTAPKSNAKPSIKTRSSRSAAASPPESPAVRKRPSTRKSHADARAVAPDRPIYSEAEVERLFAAFARDNPEPKGELDHVNAFTLLVAVVLSAQATDVGVNKATAELFRLADTPAKMLALGEDRVRDLIKTIGLYRTKARNVILLCEQLLRDHGGEVPNDHEALTRLPGVGRKTANVVLNAAFGVPVIAVDTHIYRVANRIGLAPGKTPDAVEDVLMTVVPAAYRRHAHHWLILLGRYVCKATKPECERCLIAQDCRWPGNRFGPAAPASAGPG